MKKNPTSQSRILNSRVLPAFFLCSVATLLGTFILLSFAAPTRASGTLTATGGEHSTTTADVAQSACVLPYLQVDGPGSAGTISSDPTMGELTIQSVNLGEPFTTCSDNSITFLMKVSTLDPGGTGMAVLPPNSEWHILFNIIGTDNQSHTIWVALSTFAPDTPATPAVILGRRDPCTAGCGTFDSPICMAGGSAMSVCPALSTSFTKDGTIQIKLKTDSLIDFPAPGTPGVGADFNWDPRKPGTQLSSITGNTYLFVGAVHGLLEVVQTTGGGSYTRIGNIVCNGGVPTAGLTAMPMSGSPPLMVNFDGSTSTDSNTCATIDSYTLDFGDGSATVTHDQTAPTFSHTYSAAGDYTAKLTVGDTAGLVSTNQAQVMIHVASAQIQLSSTNPIVSRKTHGSAGDFDINLSLTGQRGVECRTGGPNSDYTMVFTFTHNLVSVGSASVTSGIGLVNSSAIGPNPNQYTVHITSVGDRQYLTVTLLNAKDTTGATGDIVGPQMGVLVGDVNASGLVTSGDTNICKGQALKPVTTVNFRSDVNASGAITTGDVNIIKANALHSLPSPP